jgi:hypothetical protein
MFASGLSLDDALVRVERGLKAKVDAGQWDFSPAEIAWVMKRTRDLISAATSGGALMTMQPVVKPHAASASAGPRVPGEMSVMSIEEAAKYLFVSRAYIRKLLATGKLAERLPGGPNGRPDIDIASVERYRTEMEAAQRAYLDSQTEDNDPLGL